MRQAFELYPTLSCATGEEGQSPTPPAYPNETPASADDLIRCLLRESEDKTVFTLFNHDFTQGDIAAINMVLNTLALILAIATLIKRK